MNLKEILKTIATGTKEAFCEMGEDIAKDTKDSWYYFILDRSLVQKIKKKYFLKNMPMGKT